MEIKGGWRVTEKSGNGRILLQREACGHVASPNVIILRHSLLIPRNRKFSWEDLRHESALLCVDP